METLIQTVGESRWTEVNIDQPDACYTFLLKIQIASGCLNFEWSSEGLTEYVHVTEIDEQDELFIEELDSEFYFEQYEGNGSSKTLDILKSVLVKAN